MTPLADIIIRQIQATGPITLADYMAMCLLHPEHGYYQQEKVFGKDGDFTTAPEISQMFGEIIGMWLADRWICMGRPRSFLLVEAGPGRGTLMADIFRTILQVPGMSEAADIHFIEASAQLRRLQAEKVPQATWHDTIDTLPDGPTLLIANEFLDALPIHQFVREAGNWLEKRIAVVDGELVWVRTPVTGAVSLINPAITETAEDGDNAEVCPAATAQAKLVSEHLRKNGGAALFIDYGYFPASSGDTFQALEHHKYADPLARPGKADLTAHVDFEMIRNVALASGLKCPPPAPQGDFLMAIGLGARAERLARGKDEPRQGEILAALTRLTAPDEMGTLFKVLAMQSPDLPLPPGFAP